MAIQTSGPGNEATRLRRALPLWQVSIAGIGVILGAGVYALIGNLAEEMHDPRRNLPRALFVALAGSTAI